MVRFRWEDSAFNRAVDVHGIHAVEGPIVVGGASFLNVRTGLFRDFILRRIICGHRFRPYLEFLEQVSEIAAKELVSAANSPVDLFPLIAADKEEFQKWTECIMLSYMRECRTNSISQQAFTDDEMRTFENFIIASTFPFSREEKKLNQRLRNTVRYFAYRRLLVKLDSIQSNSDPEDVLKRLKSSTEWSKLEDHALRRGLKSHKNLLKKHETSKMAPASSISEYENVVLEKINSEMSLDLQNHLEDHDWMLMEQYYNRMKLTKLARHCATQAQTARVILVEEALPVEHLKKHMLSTNPEVKKLPFITKQAVKQTLEGYWGRINERFRNGAARGKPWQLVALGTLVTVATVGIRSRR